VDNEMRGRIMSLYAFIFRGMPAAGALVIGPLAESLGLRVTFAIAAGICLLAWLAALRRRVAMTAALEAERA
jgi:MFS family permease